MNLSISLQDWQQRFNFPYHFYVLPPNKQIQRGGGRLNNFQSILFSLQIFLTHVLKGGWCLPDWLMHVLLLPCLTAWLLLLLLFRSANEVGLFSFYDFFAPSVVPLSLPLSRSVGLFWVLLWLGGESEWSMKEVETYGVTFLTDKQAQMTEGQLRPRSLCFNVP